ncbi:MAG: hypothetical protein GKR89_17455 [Candidatus Latescibacteria bacterium]|nr:hypothetical protein [Candidatus Latescibacterota bacterium]
MFGFGGFEMVIIGLAGLLAFAFWVWMMVDCLTNDANQGTEKLIWVLVLIFAPFVGTLIYYYVRYVRRPKRL